VGQDVPPPVEQVAAPAASPTAASSDTSAGPACSTRIAITLNAPNPNPEPYALVAYAAQSHPNCRPSDRLLTNVQRAPRCRPGRENRH